MRTALARAAGLLSAVERLLAGAATLAAAAIMLIIVADVALRYAFRHPLAWATEVVGWYLMVFVFYAALSSAFTQQSHVRVDILRNLAPRWLQRLFEVAICTSGAAVFGLASVLSAQRAAESLSEHEVMSGVIAWPTWPPPAIVAAGTALMALRLVLNAVAHAAAAAGGGEVVALPAPSGHGAEVVAE